MTLRQSSPGSGAASPFSAATIRDRAGSRAGSAAASQVAAPRWGREPARSAVRTVTSGKKNLRRKPVVRRVNFRQLPAPGFLADEDQERVGFGDGARKLGPPIGAVTRIAMRSNNPGASRLLLDSSDQRLGLIGIRRVIA